MLLRAAVLVLFLQRIANLGGLRTVMEMSPLFIPWGCDEAHNGKGPQRHRSARFPASIPLIHAGFTVGAHSVDHPLYATLTLEQQLAQTIQSLDAVRRMFDTAYGAFAFPHSDENVSRTFFASLASTGLADVSFGTGGLVDEDIPNHYQRVGLDSPAETADQAISFHLLRRMVKNKLRIGKPSRAK
jgi:peptidoglycan/xylan/chitin deacetylase (PgdA/CDA1 family)